MFEFTPESFTVKRRYNAEADLPPIVKRVEAQRAKQERRIQRAFFKYIDAVTSTEILDEVAAMYRRGDLLGMMNLPEPYIKEFAGILRTVFIDTAVDENKHLMKELNIVVVGLDGQPVEKVNVSLSVDITFNPGDSFAADFMRRSELEFIREITKQQQAVIRKAMTEALENGMGYVEASRLFKNNIGLTSFQQNAVRNYRRLLETNNAEALTRALRDRRFDPSISRAIRQGSPLSGSQIDKMTNRYQSRMLDMRAETIARTEGQAVTNAARHSSTSQMLEKAGIPESDMIRIWHTTIDTRERATHRAMNKQRKGWNEPFRSPSGAKLRYPGDRSAPAAEVINCRCVLESRMKEPGEVQVPATPPPQALGARANPMTHVADDIYKSPSTALFPQAVQNVDLFLPEIASAQGKAVQNAIRDLERKLERLANKGEVFVRVPGDSKVLDDILASGKVKNRFEAGVKSNDLLHGKRLTEEYNLFGLAKDAPAASRPVYGYVTSYVNSQPGRALVNNYGNVAFKLKKAKRPDITITGGDSLRGELRPSPLNKPSIDSFDARRAFHTTNIEDAAMDYVEAHIGKGLRLEDIDEVLFYETARKPNLMYAKYKDTFERLGIRARLITERPRTLPTYELKLGKPLKPKAPPKPKVPVEPKLPDQPKTPSGFTQEQHLFRAAWADTATSLEQMIQYDLARGVRTFKGAEKKAFDGIVKESKNIISAIDTGKPFDAISAVQRALKFSDELEALAPGPTARLYTQWIRTAARKHQVKIPEVIEFKTGGNVWVRGSRIVPEDTGWSTSPIPEVKSTNNPLTVLKPDRGDAWDIKGVAKEVEVKIDSLTSWQTGIDVGKIRPLVGEVPPIKLAQVNGELIIMDGNHRVVSAWLSGDTTIKASFVNFDAAKNMKWFKPKFRPKTPKSDSLGIV